MSYTPTSWTTGDTITASALNKIENGIANAGSGGGGGTQITFTEGPTGVTLNASYNDLREILVSGSIPFFVTVRGSIAEEMEEVDRYQIGMITYDETLSPDPTCHAYAYFCPPEGVYVMDFSAETTTDNLFFSFGG